MSNIIYPCCPKMPKGRDITVTPVISTGHIPKSDNDILEDVHRYIPRLYARHEYGWEFTLSGFAKDELEGTVTEFVKAGLSQALINTLAYFKGLGYTHLNIDRDGEVVKGLQRFEW